MKVDAAVAAVVVAEAGAAAVQQPLRDGAQPAVDSMLRRLLLLPSALDCSWEMDLLWLP